MRSRAKEPPNCSTRGRSRSSSPTETATKRSSKQNETLLQQPANASGNGRCLGDRSTGNTSSGQIAGLDVAVGGNRPAPDVANYGVGSSLRLTDILCR
jgi:hypothetical protein